jgi:primosomal protein N' (replication factor Y)
MDSDHASSPPAATDGAAAADRLVLSVLLPLPLAGAYDYRAPAEMRLQPGDFVIVPLGRREAVGVVWGEGTGEVAPEKLKDVIERLDAPPLPETVRRFVDWVSAYSLAPPGAVLRMAVSVSAALEEPRQLQAYRRRRDATAPVKMTPARTRVLALLADGPPRLLPEIAREAGVGTGVVRGLVEAGLIEPVLLPPPPPYAEPDWRRTGPALEPAQAAAASLAETVRKGGFATLLLDGVTGSGKTEVYFEAVAAALAEGRQVLVLLPEIALSPQWLQRFERRFGVRPAEWHSDLRSSERRTAWRAVAEGKARLVVGARSALFLPFPELGLIVVDEEHESAFKQEDGVIYQARDMAVVRGHLSGFPVLLVSATPSLETVQNVEAGRYRALHLPERHGGAALPRIEAIDLRKDKPPRQSWLSGTLRNALAETLAAGEQALLFLNRRGYAPLTLCRSCGHRLQCPNCSAWLVEHRYRGRLQCHHCGYAASLPPSCPACAAEQSFAACGPGVERLAEEVAALYPAARTALMTSDTVMGPLAAEAIVEAVARHEIDLLIGTQIVAKGHHFPMLTLVGVVDADLGLAGGDLRAAERTYQLLHQVAGRAGRAERPGRVLLQTYDPANPVMQALIAGDRDRFLAEEAEDRRRTAMPPFGRLAALIVSGSDADAVDGLAAELARHAPQGDGVEVLGPAPAPMALLRGRHRRRFLLKCRRDRQPQPLIREWLRPIRLRGDLRLQIDIDPYSFF